jgi:diguanylate cyclase (GGDEF)-like protein/PAS domain S-box-containing protein
LGVAFLAIASLLVFWMAKPKTIDVPLTDISAVRGIIDAVPHPIFIKDAQTRFVVVNQTMCEFMSHTFDEIVGKTDYDFVPAQQADVFRGNDLRVLGTGEVSENEELFTDDQGALRTIVTRKKRLVLAGGEQLLVGCITDISDFRQAEALIRHHAEHDALTGLANRRQFSAEIETALAHADRHGHECSILLIDLDRFKPVNDAYGHTVGDAVLCEIASRLQSVARKGDTVARLGGDEFAMICNSTKGNASDDARRLAVRLIAAIRRPIKVGDRSIEVGASVGIARCPSDGNSAEVLLQAADIAMYRGKHEGRGTYRFFEKRMDAEVRAQAALETDLRAAISQQQIEAYYQPLMALPEGKLTGFEILARWNHPTRGFVSPDSFIPLAEKIGLIGPLTFSLLRRAAHEARKWPAHLTISLNLSPTQLNDDMLPVEILKVITEAGLPAHRLEVEITENALVADVKAAKSILAAFRNLGIKVALDDFGTGYSSLHHLRELTFDRLKIDRSFVQLMTTDPESQKIVNAILGLAHSMGLPATAEGIESVEILDALNKGGCEIGQGYFFGKAIPAAEVDEMIKQSKPTKRARRRAA